jgi:UDP-N-acetylmuramate dehydrogenase
MTTTAETLSVERSVSLRTLNSFGLPANAAVLVRLRSEADVRRVVDHPEFGPARKLVLGGGSNLVLTRDVPAVVLKVEIMGRRLLRETDDAWIVEAGAGENWHALVDWTVAMGWPGLENLALIPGTVGAAPVQNIGAYGVELKDRFEALDAVDLLTGRSVTLGPAFCAFGYRDSVFKHSLAGRSLITRVRFRLPRPWQPVLGYLDLERKVAETGISSPTPQQVFDWICAIRRAKLPDPAAIGNAGSFFKNPVVTRERHRALIAHHPSLVGYPLPGGRVKLAAAWLIDAAGLRGATRGRAGVYEKQALVLVNRGGATGAEILALAREVQDKVAEKFGVRLEPEPVIV